MKSASPSFSRPLVVLLSGVLFTHLAYYLVIPLLAVILTTQKKVPVSDVGLILGSSSFALLTGSLIGGWLTDKLGQRRTLVVGLVLRGIGLLGYGFFASMPLLFGTAVLAGLGGGIYTPPAKAGVATYSTEQNKSTAFSIRGIAANIGVTVGPLIGALLMPAHVTWLFITAALVHAGLAAAHQLLLPARSELVPGPETNRGFAFRILKDPPFLAFSVVTIFIWALYVQFTFSIPLRAAEILPNPKTIGLLWSISSVLVIFLQAPITRYLSKTMHPLVSLAIGVLLIGIGLGSIMWAGRFTHLLLSVIVFTFGEMLVTPIVDTIVSDLAKPELLGSYFGIASFVWGMGESLGNVSGGQLMSLARSWGAPSLPWLIFGIAGGLISMAIYGLYNWAPLARPLSGALEERTENASVDRKGKSPIR